MKGLTYQHYRNKQLYFVLNEGKVQINGKWEDAVTYQRKDEPNGEWYTRSKAEFEVSFTQYRR